MNLLKILGKAVAFCLLLIPFFIGFFWFFIEEFIRWVMEFFK